MIKKVYVAGPYTANTIPARELNIQAARHVGHLCIRKGWFPVIPHGNTYHFDEIVPMPQEFWRAGTMSMMEDCDAVVFVDGWYDSTGSIGERNRALELNMLIFKSTEEMPQINWEEE